ncbi:MAG: hypothetical protein KGN79_04090 [Acidobacteriota bacterium]|nr:hypothetical protein [Acidobacteriota bacterium]
MRTGTAEISVYQYPAEGDAQLPVWEDLPEILHAGTRQDDLDTASEKERAERQGNSHARSDLLESSFDAGFSAGREAGVREGRAESESELARLRARAEGERTRQIEALVKQFDDAREHYLQAVEREVVELALAIAARILRREAQLDPLLLTGATRVALGQLSESTEVKLRVPQDDVELWREAIAHLPNLAVRPEVVVDAEMCQGDCVLETKLGRVDLGVRKQLNEIERGFFELTGIGLGGRIMESEQKLRKEVDDTDEHIGSVR